QHIVRRIHETHPDVIIDFNYYGRHNADWTWAHPINPLGMEKVGAYFFIETDTVKDGSSFAAKTARAHGSGFALWAPVMQSLPECTGSSAPYAEPLSPTVHALTSLANGGSTFFGLFDGPAMLYADVMRSICHEVHKREEYFGGDTVKYILLHYSQQTRDFYTSNLAQYVIQTTKGTYEMLNRSQLLVDVVLDEQLRHDGLSRYKVLFLSNSACLSTKQCDNIRSFVRNGGTLIATYETSLFDEFGRRRESFELADVFGIDYKGRTNDLPVSGIVNVVHDEELSRRVG